MLGQTPLARKMGKHYLAMLILVACSLSSDAAAPFGMPSKATSRHLLLNTNSTNTSLAGNTSTGNTSTGNTSTGNTSTSTGNATTGNATTGNATTGFASTTLGGSVITTPAPRTKPVLTIAGLDVEVLYTQEFPLPSAEDLKNEGFSFALSKDKCSMDTACRPILALYPGFSGVGVNIPAGAWPADEARQLTIRILGAIDTRNFSTSDVSMDVNGPIVEFGPSGIQFGKPVTIMLPILMPDASAASPVGTTPVAAAAASTNTTAPANTTVMAGMAPKTSMPLATTTPAPDTSSRIAYPEPVATIIQTVAKYDATASVALTLMRAESDNKVCVDAGAYLKDTTFACGETLSFSLYTAVTIRDWDAGERPSAYPACGGGCIALIVTAVVVCLVLSGFVAFKTMVVDKHPQVETRQIQMTVNT